MADVVDAFLLLLSPAHGDELQGIKRGVMELADVVVVTKADGQLASTARVTQAEYAGAMKYLRARTNAWRPVVLRASSVTGEGLQEVQAALVAFRACMVESGELRTRRAQQRHACAWQHVHDGVMHALATHPSVRQVVSGGD